MTTVQLKAKIKKEIDNVPENVLPELLEHIKSIQHKYPDISGLDEFINKVFKEDDGLLRRLAE